MKSSTVSSKYQIVIPKDLRKKLNVVPGQKVYLKINEANRLEVNTDSILDEMYGSMKGAWGKDSAAYIRKVRDEWDD